MNSEITKKLVYTRFENHCSSTCGRRAPHAVGLARTHIVVCSGKSVPHCGFLQDILGLTAIIYLDNLWPPSIVSQFHANIRHSLATGARVAVHAPTTLPFMKRGITVSPGVETTIEVTEVHRVRLSEPWGTCTSEEYLVTPEQDDRGVRYTSESCSELCKQDQVNCL